MREHQIDGSADAARSVSLQWQPEPADWAELFDARRGLRRESLKLSVLAGSCVAVSLVGAVAGEPSAVAAGLSGAVTVAIMRLLRPYFVRSFWRRSPRIRRPVSALVEADAGVTVRTQDGSQQHPWTTLGPVVETERVFVVHLAGGRAFFPLAKRGVADPADIARLRSLLRLAATPWGHRTATRPPREP